MVAVGEAARERGTAVVLAIDELQYVPEEQLTALISAAPPRQPAPAAG